jgi:hypothetical protein
LRKTFVLAISLTLASAVARAGSVAAFVSGNTLHDLCKTGASSNPAACTSYIVGAIDAINADGTHLCLPAGVIAEQMRDVVARWLSDHPERRQEAAAGLVSAAVQSVFPCPPR